jgi:putative heme-binding domain-containing protein
MRIAAIALTTMLLAAGRLPAQHSFTPEDIDNGLRLYRNTCVVCHGPDGDGVPGIDIGHGKFRHGTTNEDLEKIIMTGIPGTPMPRNSFSEREAFSIVLYLRQMATISGDSQPANGDAARGKAIFEGKGGCTGCHRINGVGARVAPDLSEIGALRRGVELERSMLNPDAEVLPQNRYFRAVTKAGVEVTGRLLNEDTFSVQLLDTKEHLVSLQKANLKEATFLDKSAMPSYKDKLSSQEMADVITYLLTQKGFDSK